MTAKPFKGNARPGRRCKWLNNEQAFVLRCLPEFGPLRARRLEFKPWRSDADLDSEAKYLPAYSVRLLNQKHSWLQRRDLGFTVQIYQLICAK
jgi:hypothetical protein